METRQLIESSATITTIVTLRRNDLYRRIEKPSYGAEKIVFGVVVDVENNGEEVLVSAIEFPSEFSGSSFDPVLKWFGKDADMRVFPTTPLEFEMALDTACDKAQAAIDLERRTTDRKQEVLEKAKQYLGRSDLHAPESVTRADAL